jgi:DNA-directed RNA polymerase III subunit RPC1
MGRRMSSVEVAVRNLYDGNSGQPAAFGCLDRRLGISTKTDVCQTCNLDLQQCVGHFGFIQLHLPVFRNDPLPLLKPYSCVLQILVI